RPSASSSTSWPRPSTTAPRKSGCRWPRAERVPARRGLAQAFGGGLRGGVDHATLRRVSSREQDSVLDLWFGVLDAAGRAPADRAERWWAKSEAFDAEVRERFSELH